ncbi:CcoQ/FixQ family Cbb3-type cytochrome c oxidase assembly chaperone [Fontivita pretiosa]|uniref:CcoQ/FixQ family Cbb3-type cytochrome c oxidase assembly chaperone n=1 Tax=Fontivita pretiosa TaxID=2989684 RepID=UPI003D162C36
MFNDVLTNSNLTTWAEAALVIFLLCFLAIGIWTLTRPRKLIEQWAAMPLDDAGLEGERHV